MIFLLIAIICSLLLLGYILISQQTHMGAILGYGCFWLASVVNFLLWKTRESIPIRFLGTEAEINREDSPLLFKLMLVPQAMIIVITTIAWIKATFE